MTETADPRAAVTLGASGRDGTDGLLGRIEVIESQPLEQRAARFDQLAEELLAELQRSDGTAAAKNEGAA